ncbi:MAG: polysaccharide export protein [Proteobacteria bacterium]|nr:polysaccharide export protein [Pseudomonadota bacterium]
MLRESLGPGDVFEVRVFEEDSLTGNYRVEADGSFIYPLLGKISATNLTASELAEQIRAGLANGFLRTPQVTVFVHEYNSRKVSVLGQVKKPGRYSYQSGMTLIEAIAEAGGTTDSAVESSMRVTRNGDEGEISMEIPFKEITQGRVSDFPLQPGDIIFVAESAVK